MLMGSSLSSPCARDLREEQPRPRSELLAAETATLLIGALSILTGLVHIGIAAGDVSQSSAYTPLVAMIAAFQLGWAALVIARPSRGALLCGALVNAALILLWIVSRSAGLPIGPQPWVAEPLGSADAIAAAAEAVIMLAASCLLLARRSHAARSAIPRLTPLLLTVMFISVLYGLGSGAHVGGGSVWLCC